MGMRKGGVSRERKVEGRRGEITVVGRGIKVSRISQARRIVSKVHRLGGRGKRRCGQRGRNGRAEVKGLPQIQRLLSPD